MSHPPLPRIPLGVFQKMAESLSLDDLRQLPPNKLPSDVPQDFLRSLSGQRREIVDDLLFEANSQHISERLALENVLGPELTPALEQAAQEPGRAIKESLRRHIDNFIHLAERWLDKQDKHTSDALERDIAALEPEIKRVFVDKLKLEEYQTLLTDGYRLAGDYQDEFKTAVKAMQAQEAVMDDWIGRYYAMRLRLVAHLLQQVERDVEDKTRHLKNIQWEIAEIKKRIHTASEAMGLSSKEANLNHFIQELRQELQLMEGMKPDYDVMIPEDNLTRWMDVVLDALLCPASSAQLTAALGKAKQALFSLLQMYCEVQSHAAEQISEQEFSILDKEKNIQYVLETERFVLKYFKHKDMDVKSWGVGEKHLEILNQFEQDVLAAIRESTRFG